MSSGKHLEDFSHAQIISLIYNLITRAKDTDALTFGFDRYRNIRQRELKNNKNQKRKYHVTVTLKPVLGSAEHQEKATYG